MSDEVSSLRLKIIFDPCPNFTLTFPNSLFAPSPTSGPASLFFPIQSKEFLKRVHDSGGNYLVINVKKVVGVSSGLIPGHRLLLETLSWIVKTLDNGDQSGQKRIARIVLKHMRDCAGFFSHDHDRSVPYEHLHVMIAQCEYTGTKD